MPRLSSSHSITYQPRRSGRLQPHDSISISLDDSGDDTTAYTKAPQNRKGQKKSDQLSIQNRIRKVIPGPQLTTNNAFATNSPARKMDIQAMFAQVITAWPTLSPETQQRLIDALPAQIAVQSKVNGIADGDQRMEGTERKPITCPISAGFISEDSIIRRNVARFKRDLADGNYRKKWQQEGQKAMRERELGEFDEYIRAKTENDFAQQGPTSGKARNDHAVGDDAKLVTLSNGFGPQDSKIGKETVDNQMAQDVSSVEKDMLSSAE